MILALCLYIAVSLVCGVHGALNPPNHPDHDEVDVVLGAFLGTLIGPAALALMGAIVVPILVIAGPALLLTKLIRRCRK
jgi:hypothetical protein